MQVDRNTYLVEKSTHLQVILQQSVQNTASCQHPAKTSDFFSCHLSRRYVSAHENVACFFAKVSAPAQSMISW